MKHQSVFEPRQLQKYQQQLQHEPDAETQDEKPPPLPMKKKHSKLQNFIFFSFWNLFFFHSKRKKKSIFFDVFSPFSRFSMSLWGWKIWVGTIIVSFPGYLLYFLVIVFFFLQINFVQKKGRRVNKRQKDHSFDKDQEYLL